MKLNQLITTVWTLASEKNGKTYALRYTPAGLLVKERSISQSSLVLKASLQPDGCHHEGGCKPDGQQRGHLRLNGNFLRRIGDSDAQKLCGVMEQHITQSEGKEADADATAKKPWKMAARRGRSRSMCWAILPLLTGETVEVREAKTGLTGDLLDRRRYSHLEE